mmetsp:Transcript_54216/g.175259  ORF Transcript_54216/g.175259 Transcript_54216/m.175259 type:complete len:269 (+) Transcript_54216:439-1245(+)
MLPEALKRRCRGTFGRRGKLGPLGRRGAVGSAGQLLDPSLSTTTDINSCPRCLGVVAPLQYIVGQLPLGKALVDQEVVAEPQQGHQFVQIPILLQLQGQRRTRCKARCLGMPRRCHLQHDCRALPALQMTPARYSSRGPLCERTASRSGEVLSAHLASAPARRDDGACSRVAARQDEARGQAVAADLLEELHIYAGGLQLPQRECGVRLVAPGHGAEPADAAPAVAELRQHARGVGAIASNGLPVVERTLARVFLEEAHTRNAYGDRP